MIKKITLKITLLLTFSLGLLSVTAQSPSLKFNGTDNALDFSDYISSGVYTPLITQFENHTWEMWVKGSATTKGVIYTEGTTNSNTRGQYRISANGAGKVEIEFRKYDFVYLIPNNSISTTTVFDGTWHHIAVVGTTVSGETTTVLYVDGVADATDLGTYTRPLTWVNDSNDTTSGGQMRTSSFGSITRASDRDKVGGVGVLYDWYDGELDEFRAWGRALGQTEIANNMCTPLNSTDLYRHVTMNEGSGVVYESIGSNTRNGALVGTTDGATYATNSSCAVASVEDDILSQGISIYPNPTNNFINIRSIDSNIEIKNVNLMDMLGRTIYSSNESKSIDVSSFTEGIYFLKLQSQDGGVLSKKIIVN